MISDRDSEEGMYDEIEQTDQLLPSEIPIKTFDCKTIIFIVLFAIILLTGALLFIFFEHKN